MFTTSRPRTAEKSDCEAQLSNPRGRICCGPKEPVYDTTQRTIFALHSILLSAWPSRGGVIELEGPTAVDFTHLGLDPLNPPLRRDPDQAAEDRFCQKLLALGAKWWDSPARSSFIGEVDDLDSRAMLALDEDQAPWPTMRERVWVRVGWPSDGGLWVAEFDTNMPDIQDEENLLPDNAPWVLLARNMDEKCEIIKRIGGKYYEKLADYEGAAFLKAWEEKTDGEVGPLLKTTYS
ncbi:MAG: hypothetical protein M1817_001810 [Caeruleum heppii]|nr:MAG: hypothetical protein M1817_001810 [Caeruleum heppii]